MEGCVTINQTIQLILPLLRDFLHPDLYPFYPQQFDLRWSPVHCHRSWLCDGENKLQHLVLSVRWAQHIPWDKNIDHVALCLLVAMVAVFDLLLDFYHGLMFRPLHVQSPSVRHLGLYG
jgi:hypothetical protein